MKILVALAVFSVATLSGCSSESDARSALASAGYTEIQVTGYSPLPCAKEDMFSTGFKAKGPTGIKTKGVVCSNWFKGSTIRTH